MFKIKLINRIGLLALVIAMMMSIAACTQASSKNSAIQNLGLKAQDEKTLAVVRNFPSDEMLKKVTHLQTFEYEPRSDKLLIIPVYNKSTIEIKTLSWDNNNLTETGTAYKAENTEDGYGLYVNAIRPEGPPIFKITVKSAQGEGEYILTYNGKDGNPEIEIISSK